MRKRTADIFAGLEPAHQLNRGLVSDWTVISRAGWSRGATLRDLSCTIRKNNNGTLTSGPTWQGAKGRPGGFGSLSFDGTDDYVDCGTIPQMNYPFTVSAWVLPTDFSTARTIFGSSGAGLQWRINTNGRLAFFKQNVQGIGAGNVSVTAGVWSHVVGTYDTSGNFAHYINGVSAGGGTTGVVTLDAFGVQIGRNGVGAEYFLGLMDSHLLFSRAMTAREVGNLYRETKFGNSERYHWLGENWFLGTTTGFFGNADNRSGTGSASRSCSGTGKLAGFAGTGRPPD